LQQHHTGYITVAEFFENQKRLENNRTNGEETLLSGPAREGLALLQGLLLCGSCGRALTVRYTGNGGIYPSYQCNRLRREGLASKDCMSFRCDLLDGIISGEMLKALQPAELALALAALQELETREKTILHQWRMRLERAEYETALAERRYQEVNMTCTPAENGLNPVDQLDSYWLAAPPNPDRPRRFAGNLTRLYCRSRSEIDAMDESDREASIRGDLIR
jgi:hypothetical protein